jgi:hypothetical protein
VVVVVHDGGVRPEDRARLGRLDVRLEPHQAVLRGFWKTSFSTGSSSPCASLSNAFGSTRTTTGATHSSGPAGELPTAIEPGRAPPTLNSSTRTSAASWRWCIMYPPVMLPNTTTRPTMGARRLAR